MFDCARNDRPFYLPGDGGMKLQFFHVEDLCRFIDSVLAARPEQHIFNVGNRETVSVREWVALCYAVAEKQARFVNVNDDVEQRCYFSFYDYEYCLDVSKQYALLPDVKSLQEGLKEAYDWYCGHSGEVSRKPYMEYIDAHFR